MNDSIEPTSSEDEFFTSSRGLTYNTTRKVKEIVNKYPRAKNNVVEYGHIKPWWILEQE